MGAGLRLLTVREEPLRVYDAAGHGSGWVFVTSEELIETHRGHIGELSIYGQESKIHSQGSASRLR